MHIAFGDKTAPFLFFFLLLLFSFFFLLFLFSTIFTESSTYIFFNVFGGQSTTTFGVSGFLLIESLEDFFRLESIL